MSIGLLIKDTSGRTIIGPETFTVRLVEAKAVSLGKMSAGSSIDVAFSSAVRFGMFAQLVPTFQYSPGMNLQGSCDEVKHFTQFEYHPKYASWFVSPGEKLPCLPHASVYNGFVRLHASSIPDSNTVANVIIYVMTYI